MQKYFVGLIGLALLGSTPAFGQAPGAVPVGHTTVLHDGSCCQSGHTVCVPECYIKERKKTVYSSGCEPICLCYYRGLFGGHCGECENGHCERPHTVKYLVKKVQVCPENATKCVPSEAPCDDGHGRRGLFRHAATATPSIPMARAPAPGASVIAVTPGIAVTPDRVPVVYPTSTSLPR